jgi:biopolymer transport protein ExbD
MIFRKRLRIGPQINIIPLIDVVLMLLIFFMVTTTFVTQPGIRVNLPKAGSAVKNMVQESNMIVIAGDKTIYINRQKIQDAEELRALLIKLRQDQKKEDLIIVKADENVTHGFVVKIMDIVRTSGFSKIAIATR